MFFSCFSISNLPSDCLSQTTFLTFANNIAPLQLHVVCNIIEIQSIIYTYIRQFLKVNVLHTKRNRSKTYNFFFIYNENEYQNIKKNLLRQG